MIKYLFGKEGLLIAVLTFLLYAAVYFFERGVAIELGIPLDLITISVSTISDDFISFYLFLLPFITVSSALELWGRKEKGKKAVAHLGVGLTYLTLFYLAISKDFNDLLLAAFNAALIVHLIVTYNQVIGVQKNKLNEKYMLKDFGSGVINIAAFLFVFSFTFTGLGKSSVYKNGFDTFKIDQKEFAIVKIYGENVFAWTVQEAKVKKELTYFRIENLNAVIIRNQKKEIIK